MLLTSIPVVILGEARFTSLMYFVSFRVSGTTVLAEGNVVYVFNVKGTNF